MANKKTHKKINKIKLKKITSPNVNIKKKVQVKHIVEEEEEEHEIKLHHHHYQHRHYQHRHYQHRHYQHRLPSLRIT